MRLNSELTYSKILAYLILLTGIWGSIYFDDSYVLIRAFEFAGIVMAIKAGASEWRKYKIRKNKDYEGFVSE